MPKKITELVNSILVDPVKVAVTPVSSTVDKIKQSVYLVDKANKNGSYNGNIKKESSKKSYSKYTSERYQ